MPPSYTQSFSTPFEYPVYFIEGLFDLEQTALREVLSRDPASRPRRVLAVVDAGVADAWPDLADQMLRYGAAHSDVLSWAEAAHVVPGGETAKNDPAVLAHLLARLDALRIDRHSFVLAIGGGAVLDLAGYAAAITHRGVRAVRAPTTVLSQADSGVGVKNGVNAYGKKNFWGTFTPPYAVLNDARFLRTLSARDRIAGMAEAVKVALVRDRTLFDWIEAHADALRLGDDASLHTLVERCARLHLAHIASAGDPFERGSARPLDYGHWSAHKLENMTEYRLRHGEAVAIGIAIDTLYSARIGRLQAREAERVCSVLRRLGFKLWDPALVRRADTGLLEVLSGLEDFREHLGGELNVPLLSEVGRAHETHEIDAAELSTVIAHLTERELLSG